MGDLLPLSDRLIVRFDAAAETVTTGGLILMADVQDEKVREATVTAAGPKVEEVKVGDRVLLSAYSGTTLPHDENCRFIREADVLGVLNV